MNTGFDKISFFQDIMHQTMTVKDVVERYKVSPNTARNWVKSDPIKIIPGSYPYLYTHVDNKVVSMAPAGVDLSKYIKIPVGTTDELLEQLLQDNILKESSYPAVLRDMIKRIDSKEKLHSVEGTLLTTILVARRYYERIIDNE